MNGISNFIGGLYRLAVARISLLVGCGTNLIVVCGTSLTGKPAGQPTNHILYYTSSFPLQLEMSSAEEDLASVSFKAAIEPNAEREHNGCLTKFPQSLIVVQGFDPMKFHLI